MIWPFFARRSPPIRSLTGGHGVLKGLFALIDRRREELERQAFALGRQLYKDSSKVFTSSNRGVLDGMGTWYRTRKVTDKNSRCCGTQGGLDGPQPEARDIKRRQKRRKASQEAGCVG